MLYQEKSGNLDFTDIRFFWGGGRGLRGGAGHIFVVIFSRPSTLLDSESENEERHLTAILRISFGLNLQKKLNRFFNLIKLFCGCLASNKELCHYISLKFCLRFMDKSLVQDKRIKVCLKIFAAKNVSAKSKG
jgi:hypothetical protein